MQVVVTRPQDRAQATASKLYALGHEPLLLPLSAARHLHDEARVALARSYPTIAITSAEALRAADKDDLVRHLATPLFAVGRKTAEAAADLGFTDIRIAAGDGASLAELISVHGSTELLYLTGRPRSTIFETELTKRGLRHIVAECYEMVPLAPPPDQVRKFLQPKRDAVLFHSRETARLFFQTPAVAADLRGMTPRIIACLSARVAEIVPTDLHDRVRIAERPDEASLLALL